MPNWASLSGTTAYWSSTQSLTNVGLENITLTNGTGVGYGFVDKAWMKNVKMDSNSGSRIMNIYYSQGITIRDSYIFENAEVNDPYGLSCWVSSDILFENNIIQRVRSPIENEQCSSTVAAYNYIINNHQGTNGPTQPGINNHGTSCYFWLLEGNDTNLIAGDVYYGGCDFETAFRNRLWGWDGFPASGTDNSCCITEATEVN